MVYSEGGIRCEKAFKKCLMFEPSRYGNKPNAPIKRGRDVHLTVHWYQVCNKGGFSFPYSSLPYDDCLLPFVPT